MLNIIKAAVDLLIPKSCFGCGKLSSTALCSQCTSSLRLIDGKYCNRCGYPTIYEVNSCRQCSGKRLYFSKVRSLLVYEGEAKKALTAVKKENGYALIDFFFCLALDLLGLQFFKADAVTFIPSNFYKRIGRGHNLSEQLAQCISYRVGIPAVKIIEPNKIIKDQAFLDRQQRQENLKNAFRVKKGINMKGTVLLVDDIYTTGATVNEASRALASVGIKTKVFTIGRTL